MKFRHKTLIGPRISSARDPIHLRACAHTKDPPAWPLSHGLPGGQGRNSPKDPPENSVLTDREMEARGLSKVMPTKVIASSPQIILRIK